MCLSVITKTIDHPTDDERIAWKLFEHPFAGGRRDLVGPHYSVAGGELDDRPWPRGQWLKAEVTNIYPPGYDSGFHCYRSRAEARSSVGHEFVVRVLVRRVKYEGRQDGRRVLVADELFIPE